MNVFRVTIQAFIMGDTDPREWSQDALMCYLIDHQKAVAVSECVKLVPECAAVPAIEHQRKERKETDRKAKNKKTKRSIKSPRSVSLAMNRFTLDRNGRIRTPSEESSNGSLVVHHANGKHEFYDASTGDYYISNRPYRFRKGTGEVEFEYRSHQYIGIAQRKDIGTFESIRRKKGWQGIKVYLTKIESGVVSKESYAIQKMNQKVREEIANKIGSSESDVNNDTDTARNHMLAQYGVVRFDKNGKVKQPKQAAEQ